MHVAARHASAIVARLIYLSKLRDTALRFYVRALGDAARVRASWVARDVAMALEIEDSPAFRADLTMALRGAGWRSVRVGQVRLWKGVTQK